MQADDVAFRKPEEFGFQVALAFHDLWDAAALLFLGRGVESVQYGVPVFETT